MTKAYALRPDEDMVGECPVCRGGGCEYCGGVGKLVIPSKVQEFVSFLQGQIIALKATRFQMLDAYITWTKMPVEQLKAARESYEKTFPGGILDYDNRFDSELDRRLSGEFIELEEHLARVHQSHQTALKMLADSKQLWRAARKAMKPPKKIEAPPPPPKEKKRTKAAGKVCSKPKCPRDAKVWDERNRGWCRPHAYERGLLARDKPVDKEKE